MNVGNRSFITRLRIWLSRMDYVHLNKISCHLFNRFLPSQSVCICLRWNWSKIPAHSNRRFNITTGFCLPILLILMLIIRYLAIIRYPVDIRCNLYKNPGYECCTDFLRGADHRVLGSARTCSQCVYVANHRALRIARSLANFNGRLAASQVQN